MEVASLVLAWSLLGQAGSDPFGSQSPPIPNVASPATPTVPAATPRYGTMPPAATDDRYAQPTSAQTAAPPDVPNYTAPPSYSGPPSYSAPPGSTTSPGYAAPSGYAAPPSYTPPPSYAAPSNYVAPPKTETQPAEAIAASANAPAQNDDKSGAGDLVRESLVLPKSLPLAGKATSLDEVFNHVGDRRRQIDAVRAYWKLTADVADYHFAWQHTQFLKLLSEVIDGVEKGPDLQRAKTETTSRYAEAQARQREAEMKLATTQAELADRASLPAANRQPLPKSLPHVGVYNTSFDKVYAHRTPPARAYLLNRTLPLWREIIAMRAETVWASQDAYDAAFDAYRKGALEVDDVFLAVEELRERRSEFIGSVRRYNDEIAEYALTSAPEGTTRETLVGMLIKNSHTPKLGRAVVPTDAGGILPVTYVDEFGNQIAPPIAVEGESTEAAIPATIIEPQAMSPTTPTSIPRNALPSAAFVQPAGDIELTSATLPITTLPITTTPASSASSAEPNLFPAAGAALPLATPAAQTQTAPVRGVPTLAPPQQPTSDSPLKFKVNKAVLDDAAAQQPPRELPPEVAQEAKPIEAQPLEAAMPVANYGGSSYSSGTHPKKKSKPAVAAAEVAPAEPTTMIVVEPEPTAVVKQPFVKQAVAEQEVATAASTSATTNIHVDPAVEPAGYYTQLGQLPSPRKTQELVEQLHGSRGLPATQDRPTTLDECVSGSEPAHRREIIAAYWLAAEYATRYRVWTQKLERLESLSQSALQFRDKPAGSIAMLQIRAEKLSIEAHRRGTLVDLTGAQWTLTNDARRSLAGPWLLPSTAPHAGSYQTKLQALPPAASASPRLIAAAERIPKLHETLLYRADAVTAADASSDLVLQKYGAGQTSIATALSALRREAKTTNDLLATVTRYNLDIAEYALAAVPGTAPREALVGALVVDRVRR